MALGLSDHVWSIGELLDAAIATQPIDPVVTAQIGGSGFG